MLPGMPDASTTDSRLGRFIETPVAGEVVRAFVPPPLPPEPPIDVLSLLERLSLAERALGRLDGITMLLPQQTPFVTSNQLVERTGLSSPTVNAALADLERLGIVEEVTGRRRGRVFGYRRYLAILSEGTDPLPTA